jgi:hypothetical protein
MSSLDYSAQLIKLLAKPSANHQSIKRVMADLSKGLPSSDRALFLPFVNERSPRGMLLQPSLTATLETPRPTKKLPKLKHIKRQQKLLEKPSRFSGGVPGVGQYDPTPLENYKAKSPQHKFSSTHLPRSKQIASPKQQHRPKEEVQSTPSAKSNLKLPIKAHLSEVQPLHLKNYLSHISPLSEVQCPAFPPSFMELGHTQHDGIRSKLVALRKFKRELRRKAFCMSSLTQPS